MRRGLALGLVLAACSALGCTHQIAFDEADPSWHYVIDAPRAETASLVAVVSEETLADSYAFRAFSTGIAHKWVAQYGRMLIQVADVELPQLVGTYARRSSYEEPRAGDPRLVLELRVTSYRFADFGATLTLQADAYGPDKTRLFSRSYTATGEGQAGKMIGLGAFGQKSAVRQSSLDAFRNAFAQLRVDLLAALASSRAPGEPASDRPE